MYERMVRRMTDMPRWNGHCLLHMLWLGLLLLSACSTQPGAPIDPSRFPFLRAADQTKVVVWRQELGPDFSVFYGHFKQSRTSGFGFYRGGFPDFHPGSNARIVSGRLGAFPVDWHETSAGDPAVIEREAVFDYRTQIRKIGDREFKGTVKIHIWVYGSSAREVGELTDYLGGLAIFASKPEDVVYRR